MNKIEVIGKVKTEPQFSHIFFGEQYFEFSLDTVRKSGAVDTLSVIVPEIYVEKVKSDKCVSIIGEIRTRNWKDEQEKSHMSISVFALDINETEQTDINSNITNIVGYICKPPVYRETPLGRQLCDFIVASNRDRCNRADYLPCIAWGRNAERVREMEVGTQLEIVGRLQSREYVKNNEPKLAYEVSVSALRVKRD